ncbi:tetratricopeptide repeat protein [Micromonospora maritima]|uniref:Tetratricopeptide repeat protein n=1 Tax=Micromonospora maritima TaxID=986711 RepID=A0ABW7ZNG4_9ACTN
MGDHRSGFGGCHCPGNGCRGVRPARSGGRQLAGRGRRPGGSRGRRGPGSVAYGFPPGGFRREVRRPVGDCSWDQRDRLDRGQRTERPTPVRWPSLRRRRRSDRSVPEDALPDPAGSRRISATDVQGIASTGDYAINAQTRIDHATVLPPEALSTPESVPAPACLTNLPGRHELFLGREEELRRLDATAASPGVVVVQAVHGLGGVGKSTLAARWAGLRAGVFAPIWWIMADNPAGLDAGLVALAGGLQPGLAAMLPATALREWAVRWLASHEGWLLVLDNVNDPADMADLVARLPQGRILVTSRRATGWPEFVTTVRLDVLDLREAVTLLARVAARGGVDVAEVEAGAVCTELGCLPLAVEQAGAYMAQTGTSPTRYLELLARYPADIYRDGEEGRAGQRTIARVWQVTLDALADDPLPGRLLRLMAWYAPEPIPRMVVNALAGANTAAINRAIGRLAAYNMIAVEAATGEITVHRLVQAVARTPDEDNAHRQPADVAAARTDAVTTLRGVMPSEWHDPASWPRWRALLPHLDAAVVLHSRDLPSDTERLITEALLLNLAAMFLLDQGDLTQSTTYLERALADCRRVLGDDHPDTLACVNNLAYAYQTASNPERVIPLCQQVISNLGHVMGDDHPDTLTAVNNLAYAYHSAGNPERAIPLFTQVLTDRRRVLGDDHPDTLDSVSNLALAYHAAGDLGRAIPLFIRVLDDRRRVLGHDHPKTLSSVNNLASSYQAAGDLKRAIRLFERALTDRRRILGDHPDTLASINNVASAYHAAGDLERALPLFEQAVTGRRRALGDDHPDTLTSMNNLAHTYEAAGDLERALPLFHQVLSDRRRVLDVDHPDTLTSVNSLACAYHAAGDLERALPLCEETLAGRRRVLGDDHPDTLASLNNLAHAYHAAGDLERALPLFEQALTDRRRVLGDDHPGTLTSVNGLAHAYEAAGDLERAIPLFEQALTDRRRVLGDDHPDTLISINNLAHAHHAAGDLERAASLFREALADCRRALGESHRLTRLVTANTEAALRE